MKLFLDDTRVPSDVGYIDKEWCIVRNYVQFKAIIDNIIPDEISFDHDLGDYDENGNERDGLTCAKYFANKDKTENCFHKDFKWKVHSANPIGAKRITDFLTYWEQRKKMLEGT